MLVKELVIDVSEKYFILEFYESVLLSKARWRGGWVGLGGLVSCVPVSFLCTTQ